MRPRPLLSRTEALLATIISERTAPEQTTLALEGYTTVAPWVGRVSTEDGLIGHAEIRVGDTVVLAFDSLLRVFVADADEAFPQAVAAGGHVVTSLADDAFGQRGGRIKDPFGNV